MPGPGKAELVFSPAGGGAPVRITIHDFGGPGVIMGMHNQKLVPFVLPPLLRHPVAQPAAMASGSGLSCPEIST